MFEKIEKIRRQPENVRLRWVFMCVAVSMFAIFAIWLFSITMMFRKNNYAEEVPEMNTIGNQIQNLKEQSESLKDYADQQLVIEEDEPKNAENPQASPEKNPEAEIDAGEIPLSNGYSELKNLQQ